MAIDPTNLTQSELLQLVNATPLGVVLTRSRLRRQMDVGAFRFGDGTHVHLVRYVRWLVGELDKPRAAPGRGVCGPGGCIGGTILVNCHKSLPHRKMKYA